jgi:hypothetical protein
MSWGKPKNLGMETVETVARFERNLKHLKRLLAQDKPAHLASTEPELQWTRGTDHRNAGLTE